MFDDYILVGADIVPTDSNIELFTKGDSRELIGDELDDILKRAYFRIYNLEVPLVDQETPIIKLGPNLIAPTAAVSGYLSLGANLLTLANNHILDQGIKGLKSTVETLDKVGINHLGTGENIKSACEPYIFEFSQKRIGIYACTEHEFSIARDNTPGANAFDPLWSLDHIAELKKSCNYVIVLYHGGKEHYRYPCPELQKRCRRMIDKGANLIVCQHSHCIGCEEVYKDGKIIYGQGNFIFDYSDSDCWKTSLLIKIDEEFRITYLPIVKNGRNVRLADDNTSETIMKEFRARSQEITIPGFIENEYNNLADSNLNFYLTALSGKRSIFERIVNKISRGRARKKSIKNTYGIKEQVKIANYIDCESHKELLSQALLNGYQRRDADE